MLDLLDVEEAAKELKVAVHTVRIWGYQGRFPVIKLGRRVLIAREAIERFVKQGVVERR